MLYKDYRIQGLAPGAGNARGQIACKFSSSGSSRVGASHQSAWLRAHAQTRSPKQRN